ncbi:hypothetical protein M413DRAFT_164080 [Hebeloma cylindrosporum]|uniref:Uncharacterized protein n=1 Tax=Hebeloma cylindrosporum TaxID=76867 RepID=A0A0C3CAD7_HEBCY|nr:hypothetical protein M413DRAFT_164080 [Hebeloma cylindrosporum h7]
MLRSSSGAVALVSLLLSARAGLLSIRAAGSSAVKWGFWDWLSRATRKEINQ